MRHWMMAAATATTVVLGACGTETALDAVAPAAQQAIINGQQCTEAVEPTAVAIMVDASVNFGQGSFPITQAICTGTLIAPDVVMLAAHCLDLDSLTFGFGTLEFADFYISFEADLSRFAEQQQGQSLPIPTSAIPVKFSIANPDFDINSLGEGTAGTEHDIALLFLEVAVDDVTPEVVISAAEASQLAVGGSVTIAGWGQQVATTSPFDPPPAGTVGIKTCGSSTIDELGTSLMQVGDAAAATRKCHGDSGGPTYTEVSTSSSITRRVIGVTSRAYDQSDCAKGGVDTRVDAFLGWLDDEMRAGCTDAVRVWCDVPGLLTADEVANLGGDGGDGGSGGDGGGREPIDDVELTNSCGGCSAGIDGGLFVALVGLLRRRRR